MNEELLLADRGTEISRPGMEVVPATITQTSLVGTGALVTASHTARTESPASLGSLMTEGKAWELATPTTVLPHGVVSFEDLEITPVHIASRVGILSELLDLVLQSVDQALRGIRIVPVEAIDPVMTSPQPLIAWLRDSAQFRVTEIADTLQVSRRTLYHWLEEGHVPPEQYLRLRRFTEAVRRLEGEWGPTRIKSWFSSGDPSPAALLRAGELGQFDRAVSEALIAGEIPRLQARRLSRPYEESVNEAPRPLDATARLQAFHAFSSTRRPVREVTWQPMELTDSDFEDEE